ncbi:MAG: hypothetical protein RLZZ597_1673 [Cyanobacteriota bacterium]
MDSRELGRCAQPKSRFLSGFLTPVYFGIGFLRQSVPKRSFFAMLGQQYADVAELVDALDLGSSFARSEGSSPFIRIAITPLQVPCR